MEEVRLSDIKKTLDFYNLITAHHGGDPLISGIQAVEYSGPGDLVFADCEQHAEVVKAKQPSAVVVSSGIAELFPASDSFAVLESDNVKLAHALIKQRHAGRDFLEEQWQRIHPSAVIHNTADVPSSTSIGPNVSIGQDVRLGHDCHILAGVVIENGAVLGDLCVVHPNAVIGYECRLGNDVEIGAGTVIGSEGYGFAQDDKQRSHKIPQTGTVVIGDRVLIGAGNCIDRGTYGETRIGAGTKTDNLCHIAHNVEIGEDCLFTSMFCVAGSTRIGNRVMTSGQTGIIDHLTICDDVALVHRAGVTSNIDKPGAYAGLPAQPLKQYLKSIARLRNIDELSRKVSAVGKELKKLRGR